MAFPPPLAVHGHGKTTHLQRIGAWVVYASAISAGGAAVSISAWCWQKFLRGGVLELCTVSKCERTQAFHASWMQKVVGQEGGVLAWRLRLLLSQHASTPREPATACLPLLLRLLCPSANRDAPSPRELPRHPFLSCSGGSAEWEPPAPAPQHVTTSPSYVTARSSTPPLP